MRISRIIRSPMVPVLAASALCFSQVGSAAEGEHWTYEGEEGPEHWGGLSEDFAVCGAGMAQSPIDLSDPVPAILGDVAVEWGGTSLNVVNNGHTIQVNVDEGSGIILDGKPYALLQFHFHHPSEHTLDGRYYPMEVHFVHAAADGSLAVLGVFIAEGEADGASETVAAVWDLLPGAGEEASSDTVIVPSHMLPPERSYYRYAGSLTTPPCSEIVTWTVYRQPIALPAEQIEAFAELYEMNARPLQPISRRYLLSTF